MEEEEESLEATANVCSLSEAKTFLREIRRYFEASLLTTDNDFGSINKLESALLKNAQTHRQSSIRDFFQ